MAKYKVFKHKGSKISASTVGINISYKNDDNPTYLGELEIDEVKLSEVTIKPKGKGFKIITKNK